MSNGDIEYELGISAGREGRPVDANPYPNDSGSHTIWKNGWEYGRFEQLLSEANEVEELSCAECDAGKARRVLTLDGKWVWDPESNLGVYRDPDQDNDDDHWLFCEMCFSVFRKDWQFAQEDWELAREILYPSPDEKSASTPPTTNSTNEGVGFVYVVRSELVRIGKAKSESRYKSYRTSLPRGCEILKVWLVKLPLVAEDSLHKKYSPYRVRGSWYDLPPNKLKELLNTTEFPMPSALISVHESHSAS